MNLTLARRLVKCARRDATRHILRLRRALFITIEARRAVERARLTAECSAQLRADCTATRIETRGQT